MLNHVKIATKDTFIYSIGNISTKIIGLILLPLYTEKLSVIEYGVLGTVEITIQILIVSFSFSLREALMRWYWDKKYSNKQKSIFFTTLSAIGIGIVFMLALLLPFSDKFSISLLNSPQYAYLFKLLIISAALQILTLLVLTLMRLQRKALLFSLNNIIKLLVTLSLTIYFIAGLNRGVEGIIEAQVIGFIFIILMNTKYVLRNIEPVFERSVLKEMMHFSYPLALSSIGAVLLTVTGRYAVRYINGMEEMGLYTLGFKVANVLKIFVISSVSSALGPLKLKMMDHPDNKRFYSKMMTYTAFGFVILLLVLSLLSKEVIRILASSSDYWSAYQIIPVLCFAQLFELLRRNSRFGLVVEKKTKIISFVMLFVTVINIGLNVMFIYYFGNIGAAIALLITQIIFFTLIYHFAQQHYFIPYELKKILMMILIATGMVIFTFLFINSMQIIPRIIIKFLLIVLFPVILYFFRFYEPIELKRIKSSWKKWKNPRAWGKHIKNIKL